MASSPLIGNFKVTGNLGRESNLPDSAKNIPQVENRKPPILVVDDNKVNQKVMTALLERLGLQSEIANDGKEAIEISSRQKFSVILMDCHMPVMDGFEATKAIRKLESAAGTYTPIIAVTAMSMAGDRERCISAGMDDYMSKPVDKELLKIKLNHWLREDIVYSSLKMARKYFRQDNTNDPGSMADLLEFYGETKIDEIIRVYLFETEDLLKRIAVFVKEQRSDAVAGLAHELKASSASIGAKSMARLSLYLEQSAGQQDWPEADVSLTALKRSFEQFKEFLLSATWPSISELKQ